MSKNEKPAFDAFEIFGKLTGMGRTEAKKVYAEVQSNHKVLEGCKRHNFVATDTKGKNKLLRNHVCTECGGRLSSSNVFWYRQGLAHGGQRGG